VNLRTFCVSCVTCVILVQLIELHHIHGNQFNLNIGYHTNAILCGYAFTRATITVSMNHIVLHTRHKLPRPIKLSFNKETNSLTNCDYNNNISKHGDLTSGRERHVDHATQEYVQYVQYVQAVL